MNQQLQIIIVEDEDDPFKMMQANVENISKFFTSQPHIQRFGENHVQRKGEPMPDPEEKRGHPKFIAGDVILAIEQAQARGDAVLVIIDLLIIGSNSQYIINEAITKNIWSVAPNSPLSSVPIIIYTSHPEYIKAIKRPNRIIISRSNPGSYDAPDLLYQAMEKWINHLYRGVPLT